MSERALKPGWRRVRLDQLAINVTERVDDPAHAGVDRYVGLEHLDSDSLRIRRWGAPTDVEATKLRFWPGDIIFGRRRAYQRKLGVADFEGICSAHAMVLRAKPDVALPEYLPFLLQSDLFMERAKEISVGSLSPTINWKTLAQQEFTVPPLNEQLAIASALHASEAQVQVTAHAVRITGDLWTAAADNAFAPGGLVWSRGAEPALLGAELEYASDGPFGSKLKTGHYAPSGARVVRLQNIQRLRFDDSDQMYISESYFEELRDYSVHPNDVLIAGLGDDRIPPGRACLAPSDLGPAINKADCFCVRPGADLLPQFLVNFLSSPHGLRQSSAMAQGTTRKRLNLGNIRRMRVPKPPIAVQHELNRILDAVASSQRELEARLHRVRDLHKELRKRLLAE
jgi:type I restriction enzyme, S subunit